MSYVRDNGLARARRRRERRGLAVLIVCLLLVLGSVVVAAGFISTPKRQAGPCPYGTVSAPTPPSASFTVNVYNAGGAKGVAGGAADALKTHGLSIGKVGNDPYRQSLSGSAQVRFGPAGAALAKKYVTTLIPGATLVPDGRDGTSVDVAVGQDFPTITPAPASASPAPVCKQR